MGLLTGMTTVAEAVAWADAVIMADPRPDGAVLDVSLAGKRKPADVVALLGTVPGRVDRGRVVRRHLGRMLLVLDAQPWRGADIASGLYLLAVEGELPDELGSEPFSLEGVFDLARANVYGTEAAALTELRQYLLRHAVFV